jgi:hypothetical protein
MDIAPFFREIGFSGLQVRLVLIESIFYGIRLHFAIRLSLAWPSDLFIGVFA